MQQEPDKAELLEAVFEHYDLNWPQGYGDRSIKCPVHDDTHASASVNTTTGLWTCFACGAGGDGYTIVEMKEGLGFADAQRIATSLLGGGGNEVRGSVSGFPWGGVHRKQRTRPSKGTPYVPPWLRE